MSEVNKIIKSGSIQVGQAQTGSARAAGKGGTAQAASPISPSSENVELRNLQQIGQLSGAEVFDAGRVEEIRSAIESGKLQINSEKIADNLIATVKDLLESRKRSS